MSNKKTITLATSGYDPAACQIGIVHVGLGAFHRAHQAYYIDRYMDQTGDLDWGIAAVNLRAADRDGFARLQASDGYVLKTRAPDGAVGHRLIRAHTTFVDWSNNAADAAALLALPSVQMVTITVTESGYSLDKRANLNTDAAEIQAEINGGMPRTIYGYLRQGLGLRQKSGAGAITVLCCDNLRGNGSMLRRNFDAYLQAVGDENLRGWIAGNVTFPCSMVDRITPKPTEADSNESEVLFGRVNDNTVMAEDFIQWVVEDNFAGSRPDLARVGVQFVADVDPYEEAKIRILNGGHTCLAYLGVLAGHDTFDEVMRDNKLFVHFLNVEENEVVTAIRDQVPFDVDAYLQRVTARFLNRYIADSLQRICMDGVSKFPIFVLPTIRDTFARGMVPIHAIRSVASWYVFARRIELGQLRFQYDDPNYGLLQPLLGVGHEAEFAASAGIWGDLPQVYAGFIPQLVAAIAEIEQDYPLEIPSAGLIRKEGQDG